MTENARIETPKMAEIVQNSKIVLYSYAYNLCSNETKFLFAEFECPKMKLKMKVQ